MASNYAHVALKSFFTPPTRLPIMSTWVFMTSHTRDHDFRPNGPSSLAERPCSIGLTILPLSTLSPTLSAERPFIFDIKSIYSRPKRPSLPAKKPYMPAKKPSVLVQKLLHFRPKCPSCDNNPLACVRTHDNHVWNPVCKRTINQ